MKKENTLKNSLVFLYTSIVLSVFGLQLNTQASNVFQEPLQGFQAINEFKGHVFDSSSKDPLAYVDINISGTNISTITNNEGAFLLKVPSEYLNKTIKISLLGYAKGEIEISSLKKDENKIYLDISITQSKIFL